MYRTHLPDLVTMDITMPGINGIDAVRLIMQEYPKAKIIMVSALSQRHMVFEALELGAKHYLIKPVTYDSVVTVVQKVLGVKTDGKSQNENSEATTQQPFAIESINNTFQIKITKFLTEENFKLLHQAVQGLLYVKPLNVAIDFGNIEYLPPSLLEKISGLVKAMKAVNGVTKVVAKNDNFIQLLKDKKIDGLLDQLTTESSNSSAVVAIAKTSCAPIAESNFVLTKLFPPEHKQYSLDSPGPTDNFVYMKKITCPVCNNSIELQVVRYTKLAIDKVDLDSRRHFVGFEPLWYSVQICSQCKYASLIEDFDKITEKAKSSIPQNLSELKYGIEGDFTTKRTIDQVFTLYYLALHCIEGLNNKSQESKLWLRLAWLYDDVAELELSKMASEKALILYKDLFQNSRSQTTVEQDQRMTMLLAELCVRNGLMTEAQQYFRDTIVHKGGNKVMNETARDRMHDIRA
jgi:uncharacterized protein (DUF2225 family)